MHPPGPGDDSAGTRRKLLESILKFSSNGACGAKSNTSRGISRDATCGRLPRSSLKVSSFWGPVPAWLVRPGPSFLLDILADCLFCAPMGMEVLADANNSRHLPLTKSSPLAASSSRPTLPVPRTLCIYTLGVGLLLVYVVVVVVVDVCGCC